MKRKIKLSKEEYIHVGFDVVDFMSERFKSHPLYRNWSLYSNIVTTKD